MITKISVFDLAYCSIHESPFKWTIRKMNYELPRELYYRPEYRELCCTLSHQTLKDTQFNKIKLYLHDLKW